mgnify:CR=1 FL=1
MKLIFNDASSIPVQKVTPEGGYLKILTLESPETLRQYFSDPFKTRKLTVQERGQTIAEYEGYTQLYQIAWSPGNIYTVVMYKQETLPEAQAEVQAAAVLVAQIQAQSLPDEQAVSVKAIYSAWSPDSVQYAVDYKALHEDVLYKCTSAHTSQADWAPGVAPSLWTAVETGEHAGTQEDPIPVPDTVTTAGMEYECGKYYSEGGTVYLMDRQGMDEGDKVTLYFPPSELIGQYFSVAE